MAVLHEFAAELAQDHKGAAWPKTALQMKADGYKGKEWGACRSCGARVLWAETPKGKLAPYEEVRRPVHVLLDSGGRWLTLVLYQSHFATCPHAAQHRKKEEPDG